MEPKIIWVLLKNVKIVEIYADEQFAQPTEKENPMPKNKKIKK